MKSFLQTSQEKDMHVDFMMEYSICCPITAYRVCKDFNDLLAGDIHAV